MTRMPKPSACSTKSRSASVHPPKPRRLGPGNELSVVGVEDGRRIAEEGGDLALVLPFGHEHRRAGVTEDVLGPGREAELGGHQGKGTTAGLTGDREAGVERFRFGEPFDRTGGAVDQPSPADLRSRRVDFDDPFLQVDVRPVEFLGFLGSQAAEQRKSEPTQGDRELVADRGGAGLRLIRRQDLRPFTFDHDSFNAVALALARVHCSVP
jgi:hypothetical protein